MLVPDLKKITKPIWSHKLGYGVNQQGWFKLNNPGQATAPEDPKLLQKLGVKKGEKVLFIAGYYADWASFLVKKGVKVDYNDVSEQMIDYVKKNIKIKFNKYIHSNYELIPKKEKEYDWTITFEACGGSQGLPIAYLRSLLNNKGGILILFYQRGGHMGSKWKRYPSIVKKLAKIYNTTFSIKEMKIVGRKKGGPRSSLLHRVYIIRTNNQARELVKKDLSELTSNKFSKDSLIRLSKVAKLIKKEFLKEVAA
ncbi:MAG: hypothetical protein PHE43_02440 [Candidatus Nanoarchaeia archaeon]|nr:hypothetical protein [Candidatus Nanoarchaeia archaeon]